LSPVLVLELAALLCVSDGAELELESDDVLLPHAPMVSAMADAINTANTLLLFFIVSSF
jgi:hypothetical protein